MAHVQIPDINEIWPTEGVKPRDQGSEDDELIFLSVGRALTKWEMVECQFGLLFKLLLESDSVAGERAYGVLTNTTSRKDALKQVGIIFSDRHKTEFSLDNFNLLLRHYEIGARFRNHIAHGMVVTHFAADEKKLGCFLVPAMYSSKGIQPKTGEFWVNLRAQEDKDDFTVFGYSYRYTHEDIDSLNNLFEQLRVFAFHTWNEQFMLDIEKRMGSLN